MRDIRRLCGPTILTFLFAAGFAGCSGGNHSSPVTPQADFTQAHPAIESSTSGCWQWGTWVIRLIEATDENPASVDAFPLRTAEVHVSVESLLRPPRCLNCLKIQLKGISGDDWTIRAQLTNPSMLTGYDVTGIFPGADCPTILQPDSYIDLYDVDGDSTTHHPFVAFQTGKPNRAWGPGETHDQTFIFHREPGEKFTDVVYVISASWPDNQEEVAELRDPSATGPLYTDASKTTTFSVDVLDWQGNVEYVLIDLEPLNGSAFTQMYPVGGGEYQVYGYASYGLSPGTARLLIAAKSEGSPNLTYNWLTVDIVDPPPPPSNFRVFSGPTLLEGEGAPFAEMDLAVVGQTDGESTTLVYSSGTSIHAWNEDYTSTDLFLTLVEPSGGDPNFPIEPLSRIAAVDPIQPDSLNSFAVMQISLDTDVFDDSTNPDILYKNTLQLVDLENLQIVNFKLTANNVDTEELDAILRPADVSAGVGGDKYGYALWAPDAGAYPGFYPYVALVRYAPPYKDETDEYDALIGAIPDGAGEGEVRAEDITGLAVWDGGGENNIIVVVSESGESEEVEIFGADYASNPGGALTPVTTISGFVGPPLDVAILPVGDAGKEPDNWFCVLTDANTIETYTLSGQFVESIYYPDAIPYLVHHIDTDTENLRIHVLMAGPRAAVIEYTGM